MPLSSANSRISIESPDFKKVNFNENFDIFKEKKEHVY